MNIGTSSIKNQESIYLIFEQNGNSRWSRKSYDNIITSHLRIKVLCAMSENKKEEVNVNGIDMNCYDEVFPTIKVKNQIKNEKKIGKIFTTAVDLVGESKRD